jgi:hypothetical protein
MGQTGEGPSGSLPARRQGRDEVSFDSESVLSVGDDFVNVLNRDITLALELRSVGAAWIGLSTSTSSSVSTMRLCLNNASK